MEEPTLLDENISEYYHVLHQRKMLDGRLERLKKKIKQEVIRANEENEGGPIEYASALGYKATVQLKKSQSEVNVPELETLLEEKGLLEKCQEPKVNLDYVEQCYLNGELTDDDLRRVRGKSEPRIALRVEEIDV